MARLVQRSLAYFCVWSLLGGDSQASPVSNASSAATCDFSIYYNRWVPTFQPHEYRPHGGSGGAHCLEACCRDSACKGLALESSLDSQCYKYAHAPKVDDEPAMPLVDFLAGERVSQWSVFVKHVSHASAENKPSSNVPVMGSALQTAIATRPRPKPSMVSEESLLDRSLRGVDPAHNPFQTDCEWTVYYDTWMPTFEHGEYTHDDKADGANAHCLRRCCEDPTCVGLTLESNELYQCYKYDKVPSHLQARQGRRLGNGQWLRQKPKAWSVYVKATHPRSSLSTSTSSTSTRSIYKNTSVPFVGVIQPTGRNTDSDKTWLKDVDRKNFRWLVLAVILVSLLALAFDSYSVNMRNRSTMFELKLRSQFGAERSPLVPAADRSGEPGFGAASYGDVY